MGFKKQGLLPLSLMMKFTNWLLSLPPMANLTPLDVIMRAPSKVSAYISFFSMQRKTDSISS